MSCFNKEDYKLLKAAAKADGLLFGTFNCEDLYYQDERFNGFTFVYTPPRDGLRMIHVAVSYCSPEDKYKPKHGKYQALLRFYEGSNIALPMGNLAAEDTYTVLKNMFLVDF